MSTALYTHYNCLKHDMGGKHLECSDRITTVLSSLMTSGLYNQLIHREAPLLDKHTLLLAHSASYIQEAFDKSPEKGTVHLGEDATMNSYTLKAALRAAGAAVDAVDTVMAGEIKSAFCLTRPPGHHAEKERAMGFCFFGNIAIAALHALEHHKLKRVAILDFDVHHGNGTEDLVKGDSRILFCSSFQSPYYPYSFGTNIPGQSVLTPLAEGTGSNGFRAAIEWSWFPAIRKHEPELVFISAGFDAHSDDPLGGLSLTSSDFSWVTEQIMSIADEFAQGRVVSVLEGGYNLKALGRCVTAHISALMNHGQ